MGLDSRRIETQCPQCHAHYLLGDQEPLLGMVCPRCRVALFGVGQGPSHTLAARCQGCASPGRLPEGIVDQGVYRCIHCGAVLAPDESAVGVAASASKVIAPLWSTQPTSPQPQVQAPTPSLSAMPTAPAMPTTGWFSASGPESSLSHADAPPGLRRRSLSLPPVPAPTPPAPPPQPPPAKVPEPVVPEEPLGFVAPRPSNIVAPPVAPLVPPPAPEPVRAPEPEPAPVAIEKPTLPAKEAAPEPQTEEVKNFLPPAPLSTKSEDTVSMRPVRSGAPALLWIAVALVLSGGGGALALGMGWVHFWNPPPPPLPPPAPVVVKQPEPPPPAPPAPAPQPPPEPVKEPPKEPVKEVVREPAREKPEKPEKGKGGRAEAARLQKTGYQMLERGDVEAAVQTFKRAIALNPVSALAYRGLGAAYSAKGSPKEAARAYRKYLALSPQAKDAAEVRALVQQLQ